MNNLPYYKIPNSPISYTAGNVISKLLDGLGYRYYWATEGLKDVDLDYKTSDGARNTLEVLIHICDLTEGILKVAKQEVICPSLNLKKLTFDQIREKTLYNIKTSSDIFKTKNSEELANVELILKSDKSHTKFPLWNVLVGPITDTGYHIGQVVAFRRAAGNPMHQNVNAFLGYTKM